jgi:pyruvate formate lyase activating enzyme
MIIGGLQKLSTIDYPGHMSAVIFLNGCNLRCGFCHNPSLVEGADVNLDKEEVMGYLKKRVNLLDCVCISGGEPTCNHDLKELITEIKALGYDIKLDTNGTNPTVQIDLIESKLIDYVAMDIKGPENKYAEIAGCYVNMDNIKTSIDYLMKCGINYEFRTTYVPTLSNSDINNIATNMVRGSKKYVLQQFRNHITMDKEYQDYTPHKQDYLIKTLENIKSLVANCEIRGI